MLPKKSMDNFRRIYKSHFGIELNDAEAERTARDLINLYIAVLGGMPLTEDKDKNNERIIT